MSDTVSRAEFDAVLRRLEALEAAGKGRQRRRTGPRDQHEAAAVDAIGKVAAGQRIQAKDLFMRHGRALRSKLAAADIHDARQLGRFLSQVANRPVGDTIIRSTDRRGGAGRVWDVAVGSVSSVESEYTPVRAENGKHNG